MTNKRSFIVVLLLVIAVMGITTMPASAHTADGIQEGMFSAIHWTPRPDGTQLGQTIYTVTFDDGHKFYLDITPQVLEAAGGLTNLRGQRVRVTFPENVSRDLLPSGSRVQALALEKVVSPFNATFPAAAPRVEGTQQWVTLLCSFAGSPAGADTDTLDYFQEMYSDEYPGMDHYWRTQSYNKVNLVGSMAFGWFELPHEQTHYFPTPGSGQNIPGLYEILEDCVGVADSTVDFTPYVGINMMFDGLLDCCAWGGSDVFEVDGVNKEWRITFNPPWSWRDITVVSHEVGHGFGLPHSNNYDGDGNPYDNPWDVMSNTWFRCGQVDHPDYGCLGQHTNAYHKYILEWFDHERRVFAVGNTSQITLDHLAKQDVDDYRTIIVPINGSSTFYYTIEARQTTDSNYDIKLAGKAVIIHEVNTARVEPAWLVGGTSDAASGSVTNGPDGAWLVGESFSGNGVTISVISSTADGFVVQINNDDNGVVAPNQLTAVATGEFTVDLAWDDNSADEDGFRIYHSLDGSAWTELVAVAADTSAYTVTNATCNALNYFRIAAYRGASNSTYSNVATAQTTDCVTPPTATPTATADVTATPEPTATDDPSGATELLINGDFELLGSDGKPDQTPWTVKNASSDKVKCNKDKDGDGIPDKIFANTGACAFVFKGLAGENSKLVQNANLSGVVLTAGNTLDFSAFVNASGSVAARIKLRVKYSDVTPTGKVNIDLTPTTGYTEFTASVPIDSSAVSKIKVQVDNKSLSGKVLVDTVSLSLPAVGTRNSLIPAP